jgi:anti-sigma B factor antagonist
MNETTNKKKELKTTFHEEEDGSVVMNFEGWLDTTAAIQAKRDMTILNDKLDRNIVLDLSGLDYISSSGLRLFLNLLKESRAHGGSLCLTGASDYIRQVFLDVGFTKIFTIR